MCLFLSLELQCLLLVARLGRLFGFCFGNYLQIIERQLYEYELNFNGKVYMASHSCAVTVVFGNKPGVGDLYSSEMVRF